jgi:PilZ domain
LKSNSAPSAHQNFECAGIGETNLASDFGHDSDAGFNSREHNRGDVQIDAELREVGGGKHRIKIVDLSRSGFRVFSLTYIKVDKIVYLTIPGFTPLEAKIAWHERDYYGCQFTSQLHIAIYDHIVKKFPSLIR